MKDGSVEGTSVTRDERLGRDILEGRRRLADLSDDVLAEGLDPQPVSGRQEMLENCAGRYG